MKCYFKTAHLGLRKEGMNGAKEYHGERYYGELHFLEILWTSVGEAVSGGGFQNHWAWFKASIGMLVMS